MRTILFEIDAGEARCGECTECGPARSDGKGARDGPRCKLYDVFLDEVTGSSETLRYSLCLRDEERAAALVKEPITLMLLTLGSYSDQSNSLIRVPAEHLDGLTAILEVIAKTNTLEVSVGWVLRAASDEESAWEAWEFLRPVHVLAKDEDGTLTYWDDEAPLIGGKRLSKSWETLRKVYAGEKAQRALRWLVAEWKKMPDEQLDRIWLRGRECIAIIEREFITASMVDSSLPKSCGA